MAKITNDDRKHAHNFLMIVKRNAYGGNLMAAEGALARVIAEERERIASRLEGLLHRDLSKTAVSLFAFVRELRGDDESSEKIAPHPLNESAEGTVSSLSNESECGDSNKVLD